MGFLPLSLDVLKQAIEYGEFDVNEASTYGLDEYTPLMLCAIQGHESVARLLIQTGADAHRTTVAANWTALHIASMNGNTKMVEVLLEDKELDLNIQAFTIGETPLHLACEYGRVEVVKQLLMAGCTTNSENLSSETALSIFKGSNELYLEIIQLFIQKGAFLSDSDYKRISTDRELKEHVLKDVKLSRQSIVNKFYHQLSALYRVPEFAKQLPFIKTFNLNAQETQDIENFVIHDIQTNSICNVIKARPIVLKLICVQFILASCKNSKSLLSDDLSLAHLAYLKRFPDFRDSDSTSKKMRHN